jgi:hypothetical protein
MESLTGNSRNSLMEAYTSIYSDDHIGVLSEEKTLNEFYEDINSLLREGYDLSDYTYDELYGVYVTENRLSGILNLLKSVAKTSRSGIRSALNVPAGQTTRSTVGKKLIYKGSETAAKLARDIAKVPPKVGGSIYRGIREFGKEHPKRTAALGTLAGLSLYDLTKGDRSIIGKAANLGGQAISGITGAAQGAGKAIGDLDRAVYGGDSTPSSSNTPSQQPKPEQQKSLKILGGKVVGYQEDFNYIGNTLNEALRDNVFALQGGKPGFITRQGRWIPIDTEKFDKKELDKLTQRYTTLRGPDQIKKDIEAHNKAKTQPPSTPTQPASTPPSEPSSAAGRPTPPPAPSRSSGEASRPQPARPAPSTPSRSSSASASTAEKIRSGLDVYKAQQKAGDYKSATQTGLDVWRLANPKLAAAADERARTRGTSATTNPQMADLKANLPAPKTQSDSENNFFDRSRRTAATMGLSGTLKNISPLSIRTAVPDMRESYEPYDIILEYLIDGGHATSLDEANYIMFELDEQAISTIIGNFENNLIAEEISYWVDSLISEGYDLSDYSWDDIIEYYLS